MNGCNSTVHYFIREIIILGSRWTGIEPLWAPPGAGVLDTAFPLISTTASDWLKHPPPAGYRITHLPTLLPVALWSPFPPHLHSHQQYQTDLAPSINQCFQLIDNTLSLLIRFSGRQGESLQASISLYRLHLLYPVHVTNTLWFDFESECLFSVCGAMLR